MSNIPVIDFYPIQMPVCPLCDNGMVVGEAVQIVCTREGYALGLAHVNCIPMFLSNLSREEDDNKDGGSGQFGVGA